MPSRVPKQTNHSLAVRQPRTLCSETRRRYVARCSLRGFATHGEPKDLVNTRILVWYTVHGIWYMVCSTWYTRILQTMVSRILLVLGLGTRMKDPSVYVAFGPLIPSKEEHGGA